MRVVRRHDPGQVHPEGGGPALARQVPQLRRLRPAAPGQVLREEQRGVLQRRLLQKVRHQVLGLRRGDRAELGGAARAGQRVPRGLLHVRPL